MKLGILASGNLGLNVLEFLIEKYSVQFVFTNKDSNEIITTCRRSSIPLFVGNPRNGRAQSFINDKEIDVLISVNYLFLIEEDIIKLPKQLAFNVHGSLLPKYRGRTPHVWAIINNEKEAGITAHIIDSGCDTGQIIEQKVIRIKEDDTGNDLLKKYYYEYPSIVFSVLKDIERNTLKSRSQDEKLATYYGKRTPKDGLINWDWHKERIYNWVRAQAYPYPGAFAFYGKEKVIIDKVRFSDHGYNFNLENGTILSTENNIIVKTPNGALEILEMRDNNIKFKKGSKLEKNNRK